MQRPWVHPLVEQQQQKGGSWVYYFCHEENAVNIKTPKHEQDCGKTLTLNLQAWCGRTSSFLG